jgi:hypothetical protein
MRSVVLASVLFSGARTSATEYFSKYKALDAPAARAFVEGALKDAIAFLGQPTIPVRLVHLRLSTPIDPKSDLRSGFQLTELVDAKNGVFAIYLSHRTGEYAFNGQLAHEAAHLLNARIYDCYVEGLNTVFAEQFLTKKGIDWTGWSRYLRDGSDPFYGTTYLMMKDVVAAAGEDQLKTFLRFARWTNPEKTRMHIDIDAWIASLPKGRRQTVKDAILKHADDVRRVNARFGQSCTFVVPSTDSATSSRSK